MANDPILAGLIIMTFVAALAAAILALIGPAERAGKVAKKLAQVALLGASAIVVLLGKV